MSDGMGFPNILNHDRSGLSTGRSGLQQLPTVSSGWLDQSTAPCTDRRPSSESLVGGERSTPSDQQPAEPSEGRAEQEQAETD